MVSAAGSRAGSRIEDMDGRSREYSGAVAHDGGLVGRGRTCE